MFPCERCGACCRQIGNLPWAKNLSLPNGICRYLNQTNNLCMIYSNRPIFCNVDDYYNAFFYKIMDKEMFYRRNKEECFKLRARLRKG
ncbi:zinc/iron-chelating domain-containing protein [Megasphaera sp. ASD88]|nr:zinc/iron-chelating domain-containing protein [Megasphaera sp. ASD88]